MKDVWKGYSSRSFGRKRLNKKRLFSVILFATFITLAIVMIGTYFTNNQIRDKIDKYVFRKEVEQDKVVTSIDLNDVTSANVYAFGKYIGVLNQAKFSIYSNSGNKEKDLDVQISSPEYSSANKYLVIAEKGGQKLYFITDKDITWDTSVDGNISQVVVNKNGYVAVVITGTVNKSVIKMFDPTGKSMFTQYLSNTRAVDVAISNDNKNLAIAEVDTSKTAIQSDVKIISIDKAEKSEEDYLQKTYSGEKGKLITSVKYQDKNKLVCMYTDGISIIENDTETPVLDEKDKKVTFQAIDLNNNICYVEEKSSGLFTADSIVNIVNVENKVAKQYTVKYVAKEIYTKSDIIALNLGTNVEFINTNGWLVKRYVANQEITNIVVSENIAGIVYRDIIEIINL